MEFVAGEGKRQQAFSRCSRSGWSWILSSIMAWSMVSDPTCLSCREIFCAGRTGGKLHAQSGQSYPSRSCCTVCEHLNCPGRVCGPLSGQHQRFRTRTLTVGPRRGLGRLPECARTSPCKTAGVAPSGNYSASCSVEPLLARSIFVSGTISSDPPNVGASQTLRNGAAARGDCLCRPPFQHPAWPRGEKTSRRSRNCLTTARRCSHAGRGRRLPTTNYRQQQGGAALRWLVSSPCASCQFGCRPSTFGCAQPTERSKFRAEMSREDQQHWEWISTTAQPAIPASGRPAAKESGSRSENKCPDKPGLGDRR